MKAMKVYAKRGRKSHKMVYVKTWAYFNGEWVYQGECGKHSRGITESDDKYNYYNFLGERRRQERD